MSTERPSVVTRFAPSPTGHLHIGGARTALFCWALAHGAGGSFLLRIEDTDQARSSEDSTRRILSDLAWLGIAWDQGPNFTDEAGRSLGGDPFGVAPFNQSERLSIYNEHMDRLLAAGDAYHAFETPEELDAQRKAALAEKKQYRYDRAALEILAEERAARAAGGEEHVIRFRVPDAGITVQDSVLGEVNIKPGEVDDFIIRKRDGFPTYHFAVVVDDELMGVTHVVRGQEHLANTPRHVALQKALGFRTPVYAHTPLIFNPDGSKMSKRDKDKAAREACKSKALSASPAASISDEELTTWVGDKRSQLSIEQLEDLAEHLHIGLPEINVEDFRAAGYLPEVVCNYLALLGWSPGDDIEKFDNAFLAERFSLSRIGKSNAKFDRNKLLAFNTDALADMSDEDFDRRWRAWCEAESPEIVGNLSEGQFSMLARALRPRVKTFLDAAENAAFSLIDAGAIEFDEKAVNKVLLKNDCAGLSTLAELRDALGALGSFDPESVQSGINAFAEEREFGLGKVAQPLRVAVTGSTVSPPIDLTLAVLGQDEVVARIERCLAHCESLQS